MEIAKIETKFKSRDMHGCVALAIRHPDKRAAVQITGPPRPCKRGSWADRLERVKGIEPSYSAWEADVLPLNYTRNAAKDAQATPCLQAKSFVEHFSLNEPI